ncbi:patatin-like phospholipase family protein [Pontibacter qinzhouensis]|uniref:Patatin-like phospholipase family protein n=1 Tax=Pontibacter qinzhouensis TaxID=2603253 RepID=A0A5C8K9C2_9BACT|nr:patatin-like phospholipase family protein [Pontibacter qinzhouensis]TXK48914.1 patatin-like phospholipase family protein [Pontibacter qinzhouensis]
MLKLLLLPLFFLLWTCSFAQTTSYRNLVFEGAGIRGVAYTGFISEFEKAGLLEQVEKVGGTSAGAIVSLTLALGYNADEITGIIYDTKFQQFNDGQYIFFGGISRVKKRYGWYKGDKFLQWLEKIIAAKTGNADITFQELHDRGFKELYVTGTSLNRQKMLVFSRETYPDMKIKDAVRISMSVPLYFEAVVIDSAGKVINKPKDLAGYDMVVDGGIIGNFPIQLFDSVATGAGNTRIINSHTLGIRIDSDLQLEYDKTTHEIAPYPITNLKDYMGAFYALVIENLNRHQLTEADWERTVSISSAGIGPKVKRLSKGQKDALISSGRQSALAFLNILPDK